MEIHVLPNMTMRMLRLKLLKVLKINNPLKRQLQMWQWNDGQYIQIEQDDSKELDWMGINNNAEIVVQII